MLLSADSALMSASCSLTMDTAYTISIRLAHTSLTLTFVLRSSLLDTATHSPSQDPSFNPRAILESQFLSFRTRAHAMLGSLPKSVSPRFSFTVAHGSSQPNLCRRGRFFKPHHPPGPLDDARRTSPQARCVVGKLMQRRRVHEGVLVLGANEEGEGGGVL